MTPQLALSSADALANESASLGRQLILTLHGVGDGVERVNATETAYWMSREQARSVFDLTAHLDHAVLTFDDGNESDYEIAMHDLPERSLRGKFFVIADRVDTPGYLSNRQIREMHDHGMTITKNFPQKRRSP